EEKQNDSVEITNNTEQSTESGKSIIGDLALVIEVIDGDTIKIEGGVTIRYLGMDTPEPSHKPPDCYAKEASEKNREMVEGQTVRIIKDVRDRDRYGRLLRYVYVDDTFVNLELVKQGYARAFTVPPDIAYEEDLLIAEQEARESKNGLWGGCDESLLNIWEQNTSERAETAEFQATADEDILEDAPECFCDYNFYDCRDFASQEDAQSLYDCCWEKIQQDLHLIDGDEDGYACEQLLDK
ncbi:thermonuclease family protein, partial [Patescibacteria group bacterium]|nr:thermonuclease family protein [Patescibacteria group bacterium]